MFSLRFRVLTNFNLLANLSAKYVRLALNAKIGSCRHNDDENGSIRHHYADKALTCRHMSVYLGIFLRSRA